MPYNKKRHYLNNYAYARAILMIYNTFTTEFVLFFFLNLNSKCRRWTNIHAFKEKCTALARKNFKSSALEYPSLWIEWQTSALLQDIDRIGNAFTF